jgi:hypothetical protein
VAEHLLIDMSNSAERNTLWQMLRQLRGVHRVEITRDRKLRTQAQNRFYWGVVVNTFRMHLAAQGEPVTANFCHEMLKNRFLLKTLFHPTTGEVIGEAARSTTELTTVEFNEYIDNVQKWLGEHFGIEIPSIHEFQGETHHANHS